MEKKNFPLKKFVKKNFPLKNILHLENFGPRQGPRQSWT